MAEVDTKEDVRGPLWGRSPASQQRRRDIVLAGKKVFFAHGYPLASVDQIAAAAGTTKRTVYDHFGSKETLFTEVIAFAAGQFVTLLPAATDLPDAPEDGMRTFLARLRALVVSPDVVRFQRLVIAEAERHPALGQAMHATAIADVERALTDYLDACVAAGRLPPQGTARAARTLIVLAIESLRLRALMGMESAADALDEAALDEAITRVIAG
jgi:TetR/AcrR family transcriptional regulator, mexJK operon transcriptional repressor